MYKVVTGSDFQITLKKQVVLKGGDPYSSGKSCEAFIYPAPGDTGIVFEINGVGIPANYRYMKKNIDEYTTTLKKGKIEIKTVEHLLSALWGLGIDNAVVELTSGKVPFLDASAEFYCRQLKAAGKKRQKPKRKYLSFKREEKFEYAKELDRFAIFKPADELSVDSTTVFNNLVGKQKFFHKWTPENYFKDIAWARSFLNSPMPEEGGGKWERIRKKIKILPTDPGQSPLIIYTDKAYITPLKAPNECARHKVLDFYGDISLLGIRIKANVILHKPGHEFTRQIVSEVAEKLDEVS